VALLSQKLTVSKDYCVNSRASKTLTNLSTIYLKSEWDQMARYSPLGGEFRIKSLI
jgi:hypothetical protein